jgi:hypothetical protein
MKTIYKYPIDMGGTIVSLPEGHQIVKVDVQRESGPCFWAIVDTDKPMKEHAFIVLGTGHMFLKEMEYIGTWQEPPFVWHLFEIKR